MKHLVCFLALCMTLTLLASRMACAQEKSRQQIMAERAAAQADTQTMELVNLERQNARALQLGNSTFFNAVYSDDFSGVNWYGEVLNKAKQIRAIQTSTATYDFVHCSDVQVRIYRDVASVSSLLTERGTSQGKSFIRQLRVLHVYLNTPGGWRVIAAQETQLPSQINR
jgi:Domain of unknown function (DUF4440)